MKSLFELIVAALKLAGVKVAIKPGHRVEPLPPPSPKNPPELP